MALTPRSPRYCNFTISVTADNQAIGQSYGINSTSSPALLSFLQADTDGSSRSCCGASMRWVK